MEGELCHATAERRLVLFLKRPQRLSDGEKAAVNIEDVPFILILIFWNFLCWAAAASGNNDLLAQMIDFQLYAADSLCI